MARFHVAFKDVHGAELWVLQDNETGASAHIWPDFGNNCLKLSLPAPDGSLHNIINDLQFLAELSQFPSRFGTPVLYPWPSRIPSGKYIWNDQPHRVAQRDLLPNGDAMHGLVKNRAWRIIAKFLTDEEAVFTCSISTDEHPEMLESYPFPNKLKLTYLLNCSSLTVSAEVANIGTEVMPFGLGFHPYFAVPLQQNGTREKCEVEIDAARQWNWQAIAAIRDGSSLSEMQTDNSSIRSRHTLGSIDYNHGLTGLKISDGTVAATLLDPAAHVAVQVTASANFQTLVLYTPVQRPALCLEPWTCTANAFNLASNGIEAGLILLEPGKSWTGQMAISLEAA